MAPIYRMMFEVSVYYTVSGIYLQALFGKQPSMTGALLILAAMLLFGVCSEREQLRKWRMLPLLLPAAMLFFRPGIEPFIQALPAWIYPAMMLSRDMGEIDYAAFQKKMYKSLLVIAVSLIPVFLMAKPALQLLGNMLIYVVFMMVSAIICMRCLRDRTGGLQHFAVISLFTVACGILDYFRVPQWLLNFLRDGALRCLSYFEDLASFLPTFKPREPGKKTGQVSTTTAEKTKLPWDLSGDGYESSETLNKIIETILFIAIVTVIVIFVVKLLIDLIKNMKETESSPREQKWKDEVVHLRLSDKDGKGSKKRWKPTDHRLAVRYYYWKYMQECAKRGILVRKEWTAEELAEASMNQFQQADILAMQKLYLPIRYREMGEVTASQAREAARLWHNLKKSKG